MAGSGGGRGWPNAGRPCRREGGSFCAACHCSGSLCLLSAAATSPCWMASPAVPGGYASTCVRSRAGLRARRCLRRAASCTPAPCVRCWLGGLAFSLAGAAGAWAAGCSVAWSGMLRPGRVGAPCCCPFVVGRHSQHRAGPSSSNVRCCAGAFSTVRCERHGWFGCARPSLVYREHSGTGLQQRARGSSSSGGSESGRVDSSARPLASGPSRTTRTASGGGVALRMLSSGGWCSSHWP